MNSNYASFLQTQEAKGINVYDIFRCGLVHELFIKEECTIAIPNNNKPFIIIGPPDVIIQRPVSIGIGEARNGKYWLVLEKYFLDFKSAVRRLLFDYKSQSTHQTPTRYFPLTRST
jgi:hypothetical protein